ncbi:helix-turn-helix domain-containing protein [Pseudoduganella eburnea]|uniref:Helix-turn-helix domain-containing protein n=1 Tax=Massilia eburnea TaxID=1776165 RepID=A0A6L6QHC9_9BURK|nr:helix-turn-helix domain-containing protein [Massilia eburnea]MTW11792.1 helix-turn-helix domain-containing protein [Massilia eburnea]
MIGKTRQVDTEPRGILVPQFAAGSFRHERLAPCAELAAFVEHYWFVGWDMQGHPPQQQETLPHPNVHLVVENDTDGVYGVHTARYTKQLAGQGFAFGVKFRPGGFRPFLGRAVAQIADRRLALCEVFGTAGEELVHQVRRATEAAQRAATAEAFLLARLPKPDADVERAAALVAAVAGDPALLTVDALAAQAVMDKRALQRLFQQYVGVGAKWVIKRYRMHEAVARLQGGDSGSLAQLALDLGYFDQAHFIKDFAALVGKPPGEYLRQLHRAAER